MANIYCEESMIRTPPQHQTDPAKKPGQIVNPIPDPWPGIVGAVKAYVPPQAKYITWSKKP